MKKIAALLISCVALPLVAAEDYRIHSRTIPSGFDKVAAFFELVKWPQAPEGVFDASKAPKWDVQKIAAYIPDKGVDFADVNESFQGHVGRVEIISRLKERKGNVFRAFAHLSHIYSVPYKQYSELSFKKEGNNAVVDMAGWYRLTFENKGGSPKIIRWEYNQLEGD